jgi:hypothetical protein
MAVTGQASLFSWLKAEKKTSRVLTTPKVLISHFGHHARDDALPDAVLGDRSKEDGWFYKTRAQWQEELGMSEWCVRQALAKLSAERVIESKIAAWAHGRQCVYRVITVQLAALLERDSPFGGS